MADHRLDGAYITRPVSIAYLTGFHSEPAERLMALAIRHDGATLIVPALEHEHAVDTVADIGVVSWSDGDDPFALVHEALTGVERVAIEKDHLSVRSFEALQLPQAVDISQEVRAMRSTKTAAELEKLRRAAEITDHVYSEVVRRIRVGQSELHVAQLIAAAISSAGATHAFEASVQFGSNSAIPHHKPAERELAAGDLVLLDFGAVYGGYCADITRVAVVGEPSAEQKEIHAVVLASHDAGIAAVRAGATAGEVDAAARAVMEQSGWGDKFIHRVGHGLGLEVHEDPSLDPGSAAVLEPGMVCTIEPGIYVAGWGGVRIEDDVVVEHDGCRLLTQSDHSLHVIEP